jgi:hypothetical protein
MGTRMGTNFSPLRAPKSILSLAAPSSVCQGQVAALGVVFSHGIRGISVTEVENNARLTESPLYGPSHPDRLSPLNHYRPGMDIVKDGAVWLTTLQITT